MSISKFIDQFQDEDTLSNLTMDETRAFVDLLILTVMIDDVITEEELEGLGNQWAQLPFANDASLEDVMGEHGFNTREYLENYAKDDDAIKSFLEESTSALKTRDVKMAALRMVAIVSLSDGVSNKEQTLVKQLGATLDLPDRDVDQVIEDILSA